MNPVSDLGQGSTQAPIRLLISAVTDAPLFGKLLSAIEESGSRIVEMRCGRFGPRTATYLLVEGKWGAIARLENHLPSLKAHDLFWERLEPLSEGGELLYDVDIIAHGSSSALHAAFLFFRDRGIELKELRVSSYPLPYLNRRATLIHFVVAIPANLSPVALRDEFLDLCDRLRVDGLFEPVKPVL